LEFIKTQRDFSSRGQEIVRSLGNMLKLEKARLTNKWEDSNK